MKASVADGRLEVWNSQEEVLVEGLGVEAAVGSVEGFSGWCAFGCYLVEEEGYGCEVVEEAHFVCACFNSGC